MENASPSSLVSAGSQLHQLVTFGLDERRYALRLSAVEQIVRMVEVTPLPDAPEVIEGVVNVRGRIVPVFDIRKRFHLPAREPDSDDHLIVARRTLGMAAFGCDAVLGVVARTSDEITSAERIYPDLNYIEGVVKLEDGLVFIHDLDTFLSAEEEKKLERAMAPALEPT